MSIISAILPKTDDTLLKYFIKIKYNILRRIVPSIRKQHKLDSLVGPIGYWKELQEYQLNFLCRMGLKPHHSLLDIGCGPLQGGIAYIKFLNPGNYVGIDIRHEPIIEAYKLVAQEKLVHKNPTLLTSENFGRDQLGNCKFDYIWASQILYHLDEKQIENFFRQITLRMKPNSFLYGDILCQNINISDENKWNGFKFYKHTLDFIIKTAACFGLKMKNLGPLSQYKYPEETVVLKNNELLEFRKENSEVVTTQTQNNTCREGLF